MTLRFASPWWLLLIPILLAASWWWHGRRHPRPALLFSSRLLLGPASPPRNGPGQWLLLLRTATLLLLSLALARPQAEKSDSREDTRGINLVFALDFSGTMRTRDFVLDGRRVSRSEGLKRICTEFIQGRPHDRLGLVVFDRDAFVAAPLTLDHTWLIDRLRTETNGMGTAIGSALLVAADHLQRHTNETRVIVLMTDAENISAGPPPDEVANVLAPLGIRVHFIQVLSPEQAAPASDLSEYLTRAAARTRGEYFRVRNGGHLRAVYSRIDRLEKQRLSDRRIRGWRELFPWFALPALALFTAELVLTHTRWRRLP